MMFLDCPAFTDQDYTVRCGLPSEILGRTVMQSTSGPVEVVKIQCAVGHWFNGPVDSLSY